MRILNAFVVAAGLGERLRPITNHIPKPLLPIAGQPVIEAVIKRISRLPVKRIGINMHYKWEMIRDWSLSSDYSDHLTLFKEDILLGTGGALKNASSMLAESPFLVHNADIISDIDMDLLLEVHYSSRSIATLAVHDFPAFNNVWINADGGLKGVCRHTPTETAAPAPVAFTGVAVYSPEFLDLLPDGESSVVDGWLRAISHGHRIATFDVTGCTWTDIGSPTSYAKAVRAALVSAGEQFYIASSIEGSCEPALEGWAALERGCVISANTFIRRSIVLPGAIIPVGAELHDVIAGPEYSINIAPAHEQQISADKKHNSLLLKDTFGYNPEISLIGCGGSDRSYFRIRNADRTGVLLKTTVDDPDYVRQMTYTEFFRRYAVPVPELLAREDKKGEAVFEDLGDVSLYVWLKCCREPEEIERMFQKVLDMLFALQANASAHVAECPLLEGRLFDYEHLRWETDYFLERFVKGLHGIEMGLGLSKGLHAGLLEEFDRLAKEVDSYRKTIVHRDFQTQNIMIESHIRGNAIPRLIDYQGARIGPPAYDLASMLWDPYYQLGAEMRSRLVQYYIKGMQEYSGGHWNAEELAQTILPCRLQRHMQALGAYGFLAKRKGKTYFLKYVPRALQYLTEETEEAFSGYPCLAELVRLLNGKL